MNKKTPWMDISKVWKRISAVVVAVGVVATLITQVFKTSADITYTVAACIGAITLMISWYVDKSTDYVYRDMEECKNDLFKDIEERKKEFTKTYDSLNENINKIMSISEETRKDTIRIQLAFYMLTQPDNKDTILKLAEVYFVQMVGDWFMTSEFTKWAKEHNVEIPPEILIQTKKHHAGE